jgi:riboflavin synthase
MFTGLVEELGVIKSVIPKGKGAKIAVSAGKIVDSISIGDSININGACQTVVELGSGFFSVDSVEETVKKTTLGSLNPGNYVNLELALKANSRLGGHFVLGHVDTTGEIIEINKLTSSYFLRVKYPAEFSNYLIPVGSIAIDGISLTLAEVDKYSFAVAVIPHTWEMTNLKFKKIGDKVNLEFDLLGKYVAKMLGKDKGSAITEEWLKQAGF